MTATPFNLLTRNSRIPDVTVAKPRNIEIPVNPTEEDCHDEELRKNGRKLKNVEVGGRGSHKLLIDKKDVTADYSLPVKLHHVKWSEQLTKRLASEDGVVFRVQVPADKMKWLTVNTNSYKTFEKVTTTDEEDEAAEFIFHGSDGVVTVHTVDRKWQLVVHDDKDPYRGRSRLKVEFINVTKERPEEDIDGKFRMLLDYGEAGVSLRILTHSSSGRVTSQIHSSTLKSTRPQNQTT